MPGLPPAREVGTVTLVVPEPPLEEVDAAAEEPEPELEAFDVEVGLLLEEELCF